MDTNQTMPDDKSLMNTGVVISVRGSVVDILFDEHLPPINSLLHARECGFISRFGNSATREPVDQGRLSNIGYTGDHRVYHRRPILPLRRHRPAQARQLLMYIIGTTADQRPDLVLTLQFLYPGTETMGIRQIALIEQLDAGFVAAQASQHRIFAGSRQTRIEYFDDNIDLRQDLLKRLARLVHMPWVPLNHKVPCNR